MTDPCELHAQESQRLQPDRTPAEPTTPGEGTRQAGCTLTDEEREAIRFALKSLDWPLDGPQLAVVARTLGPSCEVPEHRMKATLRGLLERNGTVDGREAVQ